MKKEYIEKEKAVGVAHNYCHTPDGRCCGPDDVIELYEELKAIHAADVVEVRHGHWSMLSYDEAVCTRCGYNRNTPFDSTREARERWGELPPYCEMCGAKMDGGADDEAD